ncbi:CHAT domain-containing protein, partial [Pyxidicoccus sp. 3LFB2]
MAECVARFTAKPEDRESALCFYQSARGAEGRDAARKQLMRLEAQHPGRPWLPQVLGHVELLSDVRAAEGAYRRAVQGFQRLHDAEGEVMASINLRNVLITQGRTGEAREWTQRIGEVARASGRPELNARALIVEAQERFDVEHDLGGAFRLLKRAEPLIFPGGSDSLKKQYLTSLAMVSSQLGRLEEAIEVYHRLAELARATREGPMEARVRFALANLAVQRHLRQPESGGRVQSLGLAREALASAQKAGSKDAGGDVA